MNSGKEFNKAVTSLRRPGIADKERIGLNILNVLKEPTLIKFLIGKNSINPEIMTIKSRTFHPFRM